jgi:hypothetical protein
MIFISFPVHTYIHITLLSESGVSSGWQLIATGTMAYADPDRIILKKIVLSGIPIRVRKKYAVVKHMFRETQVSYIHSLSLTYLLEHIHQLRAYL